MMTDREWSGVFRGLRTIDVCNVAVRIVSYLDTLKEHERRSLRVEELLNEFGVSDYVNDPVSPRLQQYIKTLMRSRMRWFARWVAEHKAAETLREHVAVLQGQVAVLQAKLRLVQTDAPNVWQWDGDTKGLEGLTAPVVMPAEALRQLLQEKQAVEEKLQELRAQTAAHRQAVGRGAAMTPVTHLEQCDACGSLAVLGHTYEEGKVRGLCRFCYSTRLGSEAVLGLKYEDTATRIHITQCFNILAKILEDR